MLDDQAPLFTLVSSDQSGIDFINELEENAIINGLMFEFIYNGGGVATGDFNNDDLTDLYFISNLKQNQFYLNRGNLRFENTTSISGLEGGFGFPTGVTVVDINYDGWLDIYVCKSGSFGDRDVVKNEFYINQGNNPAGIPVFIEQAADYNLDIDHYSTQAAFFDYDKDGDLDMFLINYGIQIYPYNRVEELIKLESKDIGERLYRNDNQTFHEVTNAAGIINNQIGFGLGLALGDLNNDTWPDVVVANDFSEKDHIYINQKDGTFQEVCRIATKHISSSSMGNDIADINNDGWLDIFTLDMMSDNNYDIKTSMGNMEPSLFNNLLETGLHYQYMYNTLQLNNGMPEGSNVPRFSEIAQLAGVSSTDWSWSPLLFDMDNDGNQDLFISNGIKRDFRNNDFVVTYREIQKYMADAARKEDRKRISWLIMEALSIMPSRERVNYFYLNRGDLTFEQKHIDWGLHNPSVTNGAIYADLDNDGDLDIVGNNMDGLACVYENHSVQLGIGNFLQVRLNGSGKNPTGIGARISLNSQGNRQIREQYVTRGYQSAVSDVLHFGLGDAQIIGELEILWPDGKRQSIEEIPVNQRIVLDYKDASHPASATAISDSPDHDSSRNMVPSRAIATPPDQSHGKLFTQSSLKLNGNYSHIENDFDDFRRELLLPHRLSRFGPALAVGDVNADGLDDFYIGGAHQQPGKLFIQDREGKFLSIAEDVFAADKHYEDVDALFFDADNDGDQDLYVVSGGNEFEAGGSYYADRLYENQGGLRYKRSSGGIPAFQASGSQVVPCDFDRDGDTDLFVGGRLSPGKYPFPGQSMVLENQSIPDGIKFVDMTETLCPEIREVGMVSAALWVDVDHDGYEDLIVTGEWMTIMVFQNKQGKAFIDITEKAGLGNESGWWNCLSSGDFDSDGDTDLVAGNLGLNYKYKASRVEPFEVFAKDFDNNGQVDVILSFHEDGFRYPLRDRDYLTMQMPFIAAKFPSYHDFAMAGISEIFGPENIEKALNLKATNFATCYFENRGDGSFSVHELPLTAQFSSVNAILVDDFNLDGNLDILVSGNSYQSELETPRNDASFGMLLAGNGGGLFHHLPPQQSGLYIDGEVRKASHIRIEAAGGHHILIGRNNDSIQAIKVNKLNE